MVNNFGKSLILIPHLLIHNSPYHIKGFEKSCFKQPCLTLLHPMISIYKSHTSKTHGKCIEILHKLNLEEKHLLS